MNVIKKINVAIVHRKLLLSIHPTSLSLSVSNVGIPTVSGTNHLLYLTIIAIGVSQLDTYPTAKHI